MGFFDKVKQFAGGKGMADVVITVIERQPASGATLTYTDSVVKGTMVVTAKQPCELLNTKHEMLLRYTKDGQDFHTFLASDIYPDPNCSYDDSFPKFPKAMAEGETLTMPFSVRGVDIATAMQKNGITDANAAVQSGAVSLVVRCIADVKGSPFDPSVDAVVRLLPA